MDGIIFSDGLIGAYTETISEALNGYVLLNKAQFLAWMVPPLALDLPTNSESRLQNRQAGNEINHQIYQETVQGLASIVCTGIVEDYGQQQMDNIINDFEKFDILVAVMSDYQDVSTFKRTKTVTQNKMDKVVGFIITELGECKILPNTVCVKLICVKPATIKGSLLLGAYFLGIKHSGYDQRGVLELARGYLNVNGFISYTKMGFDKDVSLYIAEPDDVDPDAQDTCFSDYRNLPMSVDLTEMDDDTIMGLATGGIIRDEVAYDTGIYNLYKEKKGISMEFLACNNLLLKAQLNLEELMKDIELCKTDRENCKLKDPELHILSQIDLNQDLLSQLEDMRPKIYEDILSSKGGRTRRNKMTRRKKITRRKKNTRMKKQRRFTKNKK
jgi:hypothetical protein